MPYKQLLRFGCALLSLSAVGCFQTGEFIRDYIITSPGMDKAVNVVEYNFLGIHGPDGLSLSNEHGLHAQLQFEMASFPDRKSWDELNLDSKEAEKLKLKAEETLRDYFNQRQRIDLITLKKVTADKKAYSYLLDAKTKDQSETAVEKMVRLGFYTVNSDLAKSADMKVVLKLQDQAQRSRLGIWRYASVFNPDWHD